MYVRSLSYFQQNHVFGSYTFFPYKYLFWIVYLNFEKINFENNIFKNLFFKLGDLLHVCFEKFWNNKDNLKKNYFRKIEKKMLKMNFYPLGVVLNFGFWGGGGGRDFRNSNFRYDMEWTYPGISRFWLTFLPKGYFLFSISCVKQFLVKFIINMLYVSLLIVPPKNHVFGSYTFFPYKYLFWIVYLNFEKINFENNIFKNLFFKLGDLVAYLFWEILKQQRQFKKKLFQKNWKKNAQDEFLS